MGAAKRWLQDAADALKALDVYVNSDLRPDGSYSVGGGIRGRKERRMNVGFSESLTDVFINLAKVARDRSSGVLICLDEMQCLSSEELAAVIVALHRTNQLALPIGVMGAGLPQIAALAGEAKSYAERLFDFPRVGSLDEEDAKKAITEPAQAHGVDVDEEALAEILRFTHGYPYFIQVWAAESWNVADEAVAAITKEDVENAQPMVQEKLDSGVFRVRAGNLTPAERKYAIALASLGPGSHRSGEVAARMRRTVESVAPIRQSLQRKGMIYGVGRGATAFTIPLFDDYLRRMEEA